MIVTIAEFELPVRRVNHQAHRPWLAEIKRRPRHWPQFACRNQRFIHRRELVRVDLQHMTEDVPAAAQVEVGMLRQVAKRVPALAVAVKSSFNSFSSVSV